VNNIHFSNLILLYVLADYNAMDTTDVSNEPDGFHIVIVLAKGDKPLEIDWLTLIESDIIHYSMKS
jgi:hypothetical protein